MTRLLRLSLTLALLTALSACATVARVDAAGDVHAFLVAVRDDDKAAFEAHVDRPALKAQIETRILEETRKSKASEGWQALAAVLAKPAADLAGEALIRPRVFRSAAEYLGYSPTTPIPNQLVVAAALRPLPGGRVCATRKKDGPCLFVFSREGSVWKLTGFEGDLSTFKTR